MDYLENSETSTVTYYTSLLDTFKSELHQKPPTKIDSPRVPILSTSLSIQIWLLPTRFFSSEFDIENTIAYFVGSNQSYNLKGFNKLWQLWTKSIS